MPKLSAEQKRQIRALSGTDMEKVILKWAGKDRMFFEYLYITYLNPDYGEHDLLEEYKQELDRLLFKTFPGRSESIRLTRLMKASLKVIGNFRKSVKTPHLEVELHLHLLDIQFESAADNLGGFYQVYDNNLAKTVAKVIGLIQEKLHEDYLLEYQGKINGYLKTLHRLAPYNATVRMLPLQI